MWWQIMDWKVLKSGADYRVHCKDCILPILLKHLDQNLCVEYDTFNPSILGVGDHRLNYEAHSFTAEIRLPDENPL